MTPTERAAYDKLVAAASDLVDKGMSKAEHPDRIAAFRALAEAIPQPSGMSSVMEALRSDLRGTGDAGELAGRVKYVAESLVLARGWRQRVLAIEGDRLLPTGPDHLHLALKRAFRGGDDLMAWLTETNRHRVVEAVWGANYRPLVEPGDAP